MFRAILFDFNGVIVDDEPLHLDLFQKVLAEEGIELSASAYYADYLGFDDQGCFSAVLERAGQDPSPAVVSRLIARKSSYYQAHIREAGFPIFPGAAELIRDVAAGGIVLGIVSGALKGEIEGALDQLALRDAFKVVVAAEDVAASKPDPEGYRQGLERLNATPPLPSRLLHPHEVLAIEDAPAGLAAAAAAGLVTLGVGQTYEASALSAADRVVPAVAGLTLAGLQAMFATATT